MSWPLWQVVPIALRLLGYFPENGDALLLLVDDDPRTLEALSAVLASEPYPILTAKSAGHAFELLATHKVGVVIADYRMPGMAGDEFLSRVRAMYPRAVRIMMSAQADSKSLITALNDSEIYKFLEKPVPLPTLRQVVRSAFDLFERHDLDSEPDDAPSNVLVG